MPETTAVAWKCTNRGLLFYIVLLESPQSQILNAERPNAKNNRQHILENKCQPTNSQMYNGKRGRGAHTDKDQINSYENAQAQPKWGAEDYYRERMHKGSNSQRIPQTPCQRTASFVWIKIGESNTNNMHSENTALYNRHLESGEHTKHAQTCTRTQLSETKHKLGLNALYEATTNQHKTPTIQRPCKN